MQKSLRKWQKCQLRNPPRRRSHTELDIKGKNPREDEKGDHCKLREFSNRGGSDRHFGGTEGELKAGRVGGAPRRVPGQISPVAIYILSR